MRRDEVDLFGLPQLSRYPGAVETGTSTYVNGLYYTDYETRYRSTYDPEVDTTQYGDGQRFPRRNNVGGFYNNNEHNGSRCMTAAFCLARCIDGIRGCIHCLSWGNMGKRQYGTIRL